MQSVPGTSPRDAERSATATRNEVNMAVCTTLVLLLAPERQKLRCKRKREERGIHSVRVRVTMRHQNPLNAGVTSAEIKVVPNRPNAFARLAVEFATLCAQCQKQREPLHM